MFNIFNFILTSPPGTWFALYEISRSFSPSVHCPFSHSFRCISPLSLFPVDHSSSSSSRKAIRHKDEDEEILERHTKLHLFFFFYCLEQQQQKKPSRNRKTLAKGVRYLGLKKLSRGASVCWKGARVE